MGDAAQIIKLAKNIVCKAVHHVSEAEEQTKETDLKQSQAFGGKNSIGWFLDRFKYKHRF